jgi:glycosyltransferase involved in cell wall biosynthesis
MNKNDPSAEFAKPLVAIVVNTSWNIFNFRLNVVRALQAQGYRVLCIAPEDRYSSLLVSEDVSYVPVQIDQRGVNPLKDFILFCSLCRLYKKHKPAVILQYTIKPNIYGSLAAKLLDIPVVNNVSGLGTVFLNNRLSSKLARGLYRLVFRFPFRVFFQNTEDLRLFVKYKFVKPSICQVIPGSGVDLKRFLAIPLEKQKPFVFLMASRLIYDKGIMEYLEACQLVKAKLGDQVLCVLQGAPADHEHSGITKDKVNELISRYPVTYYAFTDRIEDVVNKADVVVLPSYREGLSRLLLESAAMGKPLIATDVPGCRDVVRHEVNGLVCAVKSAEDLCRVMLEMYDKTPVELQLFAANSRKIVEEEYDEVLVTKAYLEAVSDAMKKNTR